MADDHDGNCPECNGDLTVEVLPAGAGHYDDLAVTSGAPLVSRPVVIAERGENGVFEGTGRE